VKVYLDTSVLVAAVLEDHPHYAPAAALLQSVRGKEVQAVTSAHTLAEFYAVLTRAPFSPRVHPAEAWQILEENILAHVQVFALDADQYRQLIHECAQQGCIGGAVYDAIHLRTAQAASCERLYTFNVRDFRELAPEAFRARVCAP
jgi:predicted nucleic acid-binding protein